MGSRITTQGVEACVAYGAASIAVMEAQESIDTAGIFEGPAFAAFDELVRAHDDLRRLFAGGDTSTVPGLSLSVIVLAERVSMLLD